MLEDRPEFLVAVHGARPESRLSLCDSMILHRAEEVKPACLTVPLSLREYGKRD